MISSRDKISQVTAFEFNFYDSVHEFKTITKKDFLSLSQFESVISLIFYLILKGKQICVPRYQT